MYFCEVSGNKENSVWFVLFVARGKAEKLNEYLKTTNIESFFPMCYKEKQQKDGEVTKCTLRPVFTEFLFAKSSWAELDSVLKEIKLRLGISSKLYYRSLRSKKIIVVPEELMRNFIIVASAVQKRIVYLSNEEVRLKEGIKVRITGGIFEGVEGVFMRIKGNKRVVVTLPDLFSVATAFIPTQFILPLE